MLFAALPEFPAALPADELSLLAQMPWWPANMEVSWDEHPPARRLETRGLIKISRQKSDPVATYPTWYAGKVSAAAIRSVDSNKHTPGREGAK